MYIGKLSSTKQHTKVKKKKKVEMKNEYENSDNRKALILYFIYLPFSKLHSCHIIDRWTWALT